MINIIVAFSYKGFIIGCNDQIPWHIKEDLKHFYELTKDAVVVMGRKTFYSLPQRPLKNRLNVVVTSKPIDYDLIDKHDNLVFIAEEYLDEFISLYTNVFVIGGEHIYKRFMGRANKIYATVVHKAVEGNVKFPIENFGLFEIEDYSELKHSEEEDCDYRFITYSRTKKTTPHDEYQYLNLMKNILLKGQERPDRTGVGTKSLFAPNPLRFDISKTIPLITTKFVGIKMVISELLWFLRGQTDSKILENQGINIWKDNTSREFLDKRGLQHYEVGDVGCTYLSFRAFNCDYKGCHVNHLGQGVDQISNFIKSLKEDPFSRRHVMTTYNPAKVDQCVLYPCHGLLLQGYVEEIDGHNHLSIHVNIRSNDEFLGAPVNIASYAILTHIIAKYTDMTPKDLIITIGDAHIYSNHYEQVELQLSRKPLPFPVLEILDNIKNKKIEDIVVEDFNLVGYLYHPSIKAPMAV